MNPENESRAGRVAGRVALVTGAASGIGKATALLLAREGAFVAVVDLNGEGARRVAEEIGDRAIWFAHDVTSENDWREVAEGVKERWNRLDILVNNAGIAAAGAIADMSLEEWRRVMAVNLDGVLLGIRMAMTAMRESGGVIVNVSSASGLKASPGASAYGVSKAAVNMLSKAAALEGAPAGIRVNCVFPGGVRTPIWDGMDFWIEMKERLGEEAAMKEMTADVPLRRFAEPEEIARAILYLASDESAYVTGAGLVIDGGFSA